MKPSPNSYIFNSKILLTFFVVIFSLLSSLFFLFKNKIYESPYFLKKRKEVSYVIKDLKLYNKNKINLSNANKGYKYYSQGGITSSNFAYFTGAKYTQNKDYIKGKDFSYVVKFKLTPPFEKIREYTFEDTYDSSPFLIEGKKNLIVAHEFRKHRTKALNEITGNIEWISEENQLGQLFFGYNIVESKEKKYLLGSFENGLHILNSENGNEEVFIKRVSSGGVTPAVDNSTGDIFYQYNGGILKYNINKRKIIKEVEVKGSNKSVCWNTIFVRDNYGEHVISYWIGNDGYLDSCIRVYDTDLNLKWERKNLPGGKKTTITYFQGKITHGIGNHWNSKYDKDNSWKKIPIYDVKNGEMIFSVDVSEYNFKSILNIPVVNNIMFAETQDLVNNSTLFIVNGLTGNMLEVYNFDTPNTSCAPSILSNNYFLSGDIHQDQINILKVLEGNNFEWKGPFGELYTNTNSVNTRKTNLVRKIKNLN